MAVRPWQGDVVRDPVWAALGEDLHVEVSWGALGIELCEETSSCRAVTTEASADARSSSGARWPFRGDLEKGLGLDAT